MRSTGLKRFETATVDNFTSDFGLKVRRLIYYPASKLVKYFIRGNVNIEQYPRLDKKKSYIFACNHSFYEDVISILSAIDRNVYVLNGSTDQTEHNPLFLVLWANGMIYVNRDNPENRHDSVDKMKRVLHAGSSVMLFPEGGYNNTENLFVMKLFPGVYKAAKETHAEVVPLISFNEAGSKEIYIRAGEPIDVQEMEMYEALDYIRDRMSTLVYDIITEHTEPLVRRNLGKDPRADWMEVRRQVYDCQKWYSRGWAEEEVKQYAGHGQTHPADVWRSFAKVKVNAKNCPVLAPILVRAEEDEKYNIIRYLTENIKRHGTS